MSAHSVSTSPAARPSPSAVTVVQCQARKLHRVAREGRISAAMPALRRLQAAGVLPDRSLRQLYDDRASLQRKHFLRLLAREAGYVDWERYRPHLDTLSMEAYDRAQSEHRWSGQLNVWFSRVQDAEAFAARHGGRVVRVGQHALVTENTPASDGDTP
ncbi:nitrous oxide reductase accessory protein NosL [Tahibacter amnicola]|uniref:Nitrous oxide reductase accessory protein NosL n=1 Tax=Tahibacter amnicola TaxID=2976241 RepID=A0ABY6BH13_9GAMM|nr:nitrous oxide reductase accessory protein NosL [Tahibacter amnicola]UXI69135.1 nitrous oxide reductase accessory protein NosL [Tahibacter amnicola]